MNDDAPVLFLDIDGVLAPHGRVNPHVLCAGALGELRRIVEATEARVVLVSSWPEDVAREYLCNAGVVLVDTLGPARRTYDGRPREIRRYIRRYRIMRWVWLDDDEHPQGNYIIGGSGERYPYPLDVRRHVQPDWRHLSWRDETKGAGLTADVANHVITLLLNA
jgi:hypothetical protein